MPIRNPFRRNAEDPAPTSAAAPGSAGGQPPNKLPLFERVNTVGIAGSRRSQDTGDYNMSVVDSGVYLPPSPTERDAFWSGPRRTKFTSMSSVSRTSTDRSRSSLDIEPFSISRESFDSYRRSFDICAKSPVSPVSQTFNNGNSNIGRQSLDSATRPLYYGSAAAMHQQRFPPADEGFEDVGLEDGKVVPAPAPASSDGGGGLLHGGPSFMRKRGFFKFGSEHEGGSGATNATSDGGRPSSSSTTTTTTTTTGVSAPLGRLLGRKPAPMTSGQGAELKAMDKTELPSTAEHDAES